MRCEKSILIKKHEKFIRARINSLIKKFGLVGNVEEKRQMFVQDVMIKLYLSDIREHTQESYIGVICLNVLRDHLRRRQANFNRPLIHDFDIESDDCCISENQNESKNDIELFVKNNTDELDKKIIEMKYDGYKYEAIAKKLKITESLVKGRMAKIQKKLKTYLNKNGL